MAEEQQEEQHVKEILITDFPKLDRTQFFFVTKTPMQTELTEFVTASGLKDRVFLPNKHLPAHIKMAEHILFNPQKHIMFKEELEQNYEKEVLDNAKSYFSNFRKMTHIQKPEHLAIIAWFVDQLVDIEKTAEYNKYKM